MKLFEDLPSQNTPINAENLNQIKDKLVVVSATEPTGDNREKVWIKKGKNLFNPQIPSELGSCIVGLDKDTFSIEAIGSDMYVGQVVNEGINYRPAVGQLIPVTPNSNITVSCTAGIFNNIFITSYNENKVSLGYVNAKTILTSSDTKYISVRFGVNPASIGKTYTTQVQVEQGSTATEYEEYIEPKIYVKNDNDVYEEFISKEDYIIKTVENDNGIAIKYPDGTMICRMKEYKQYLSLPIGVTDLIIVFPELFSDYPTVLPINYSDSTDVKMGNYNQSIVFVGKEQFTMRFFNNSEQTRSPKYNYMAIGRWK